MTAPDFTKAIPFFQPIIRTADRSVFAYEVLAREERDGRIHSLGPYFEDPAVSDLDKLKLDLHVRKLAFAAYATSGSKAKLFINLKPSWIYMHREHYNKLPTLAMLDQYAIDPRNIVIEVTEEELFGDYDIFGKLLTEYRQAGCMLAIDDFGKGASSVERIAHIMPDIIKLDRSIVQRTDTQHSFYEVCSAMSAFGATSGFNLLFEGVETASQLERCVKTSWCYLQGFIFSQAKPGFETEYDNEDLLSDILSLQNSQEQWHIRRRHDICATMDSEIERLRPLISLDEEALRELSALHDLAKELPYYCVRCYVCSDEGKLFSHVYQLEGHGVVTVIEDRPSIENFWGLFAQGLYALYGERRGYLSDIYKDVATKENIVTYIHKLSQDRLLCVDIMPTVLY